MNPRQYKAEDEKTGEEVWKFAGVHYITVFHYTDLENVDCEAIEAKYAPKTDGIASSFDPIAEAERIINEMPNTPRIENNGGNRAYYMPATDSIHMPALAQFKTAEGYYATLFHEMVHSTGHFTRLERFKKTKEEFNAHHKKEYSFEELVAELGSCFLCGEAGILNEDITDDAAAYLQGWIKPLQSNTDWIIKASGMATKATEYILNKTAKEQTKTA
jgi:antirestriction protein ArdC